MKVLFAVSNENISEAIIKRYPKEYKEILSYKNVYYFNAILKEIQKDKSYDRIVISEDLEPFVNTNHDSIDNFIFEHLDKISDEAHDNEGKETAIILICSERRAPGAPILSKLFSIGVYNAVMGKDRNLTELCRLINRPRTKKEAKIYYRIDQATYDPVVENEVNEVEIQNILTHFKKLGKNTERYADSFNNIAAQYTDDQLRIIINVLPMKVKAVLESESPKYQALMGSSGEENRIQPVKKEPGIKVNTIGKSTQINGPIVIPSSIKKPTRQPITTETNNTVRTVSVKPQTTTTSNQTVNTNTIGGQTQKTQVHPQSQPQHQVASTRVQPQAQVTPKKPIVQTNSVNQVNETNKVVNPQTNLNNGVQANPVTQTSQVTQTTQPVKQQMSEEENNLNGLLEGLNSTVSIPNQEQETVKRGRGRPKKIVQVSSEKPKGKRGRPRKNPQEETDVESVLPGLEENESNDVLPGLDDSNILPGLDDSLNNTVKSPEVEETDDSNVLPGLYDVEETDTLPGLDDTEEADTLPGLDDTVETDTLPGLDDEEETDTLPGLDSTEETDTLPGLDSTEETDTLPGLDSTEETNTLPGIDDTDNSTGEEVDVNKLLAGLDDTSPLPDEKEQPADSSDTLPGLETEDDTLPGLNDNNNSIGEDTLPGLDDEEETILPGMGFEDTVEEPNYKNTNSIPNSSTNTNTNQNSNVAQVIQPKINYSMSNLNSLLSKDKKIVTFIGTTKNGTSFLVNNLALMFSLMGIDTAILDMTQNRNSYYIFTDSREELRNIAYTSIAKLENGYAEGIKVNKNMTVYTALPADGNNYENAEPILSTLVQNHSLVLIDCDFQTPPAYFAMCQEIYLVQSMDILTIQPLTAFLRELKFKGAWEPEKARVVINKEIKVKGLNGKMIIAGMSRYNGPDMSVMTDLFNRDMVKACSIPFDEKVYAKYLETMATCRLSLSGYSKPFMQKMQILGEMVYPRLNSKKSYGPMNNSNYSPNTANTNNNVFSNSMNNTLNQMKNKY